MQSKFEFPFELLEPWTSVGEHGEKIEQELRKELRSDGILFGKTCIAIACRIDSDDVLFRIKEEGKFAVVHLTWSGHSDPNKGWPSTKIYDTLNQWHSQCMLSDNYEYTL